MLIPAAPCPSRAAAQDYRFELAGPPARSGKSTVIRVRLVHAPGNRPVPDAVIFQTRFDMGPDGMGGMTAPAKAAPSAEPGIYRIETEPSMAGRWGLTLAAKVQGEWGTVRDTLVVPVPE